MQTLINFLFVAIKKSTPLMLGTTGEIITEKSGSLNLGVEGLMAMGAIGGFLAAANTESLLLAILAGFAFAALGGLIFAFLTVTLQANQNVTGLALAVFGVAVYRFIGQSLRSTGKYPSLTKAFKQSIADGILGKSVDEMTFADIFFSQGIFLYIAISIVLICWIYVRFTKAGLKMRAIGENPAAADACGVKVNLIKYLHICLGAGISGVGGVYLALVAQNGSWNDSWINGVGWISIALVIFASWSPAKAIGGSIVFGAFQTLADQADTLASAFPKVCGWMSQTVTPPEVFAMLPYVVTALVLIITSIKGKKEGIQPKGMGINYYREER